MCTLSFVATDHGFLLAMNRDEQRTRAHALPPTIQRCGDLSALYPSEPSGGTWVGINEAGLCIALINWYSRPQYQGTPAFGRGAIIPRLLASPTQQKIDCSVRALPFDQLNPFRLFVIGKEADGIHEYRSDSSGLERVVHPWLANHWFSSGHDEASVSTTRGSVCRNAKTETDAGTLAWIERLHASHKPLEGAHSICMHRDDAMTVSLTILEVSDNSVSMHYHDGPPCGSIRVKSHQSHLELLPKE
jgi:Transport and Golgi organisation 2